jgi:hypothetical protein
MAERSTLPHRNMAGASWIPATLSAGAMFEWAVIAAR